MKKLILIAILCLIPALAFAGSMVKTFDDLNIQGASSDPLLNALISTNASTVVSLKDAKGKKYTWFNLLYNGTGTCIVRVMNTNAKASYPAIPVAVQGQFGRVVHGNALFLNYSGCAGTTTTSTGTSNSILELQ